MNRGREVLVGKLAIGRRVLDRGDAIRCFHASNGEPFWELAVRQGLLQRVQADDLVRTIDEGSLVCRGDCKEIFPLDPGRPPQDDRCPSCAGPLYVTSRQAAASRETWRDRVPMPAPAPAPAPEPPKRTTTRRPAEPPPPMPAPAAPPPRPATPPPAFDPFDEREVQVTIPPKPIPLETFPPRPVPVPVAAPPANDSLPSAIPIKKKTQNALPAFEETKDDPPSAPAQPQTSPADGFKPFTIGMYEVLAPIGKGGMGSVFRARHKALNRIVAIKIFTSHMAADEEQQKRFDREVKTMAKLDHPGIVRVQGGGIVNEKGIHEKRPYYVMEYVAGRDLAAWAREKPRSHGQCAAMIARVCEVVDYFHSKMPWVVHRDLKPQNVIVSFEGDVPKICDFGLAKVGDSQLTRTGDIMGTPQFMPPEQARGENKKIGPPTDVYSLGAILYFLLVGEPPFDLIRTGTKRSPLVELIDRIVRDAPPRVRAKNPAVPNALEGVILKCFQKDPTQRFHNARELGTALRGLNLPL